MRNRLSSISVIICCICLIALALTNVAWWYVRLPVVISVAAFLVHYVWRTGNVGPPNDSALGRPKPAVPGKGDLGAAYLAARNTYGEETVDLFVRMLLDQPRHLKRIREEVEIIPDTAELKLQSDLLYFLPPKDKRPRELLIPVVKVEKGTLLDHFTVGSPVTGALPSLPHNQVRGLIILALEALMADMPVDGEVHPLPGAATASIEKVLGELAEVICLPGPRKKQPKELRDRVLTALRMVDDLPTTKEWKDAIKKFCRQHIDNYFIVAEVCAAEGNHLLINYSHRVLQENLEIHPSNRWRGRFGLSPSTIDIPLNELAFQVETYHLEAAAEPGQYVFDHHLERLETREVVNQENLVEVEPDQPRPYVRVYHEEARPTAHLYIRRQCDALPRQLLKSVIRLREVPPGALGGVTVVALVTSAIISFFAMTHLGLDFEHAGSAHPPTAAGRNQAAGNIDIPALLIALPAFTSVLIGSWIDLSRLRRAALATYLALAGAMMLSLIGALYYVFALIKGLGPHVTLTFLDGFRVETDVYWLILMSASLVLDLFLVRRTFSEGRYYRGLVKLRVDRSAPGSDTLAKG